MEYNLDDSEIEKIWDIVGDHFEQLRTLYTSGNAGSIRQALMGSFIGTGIDLDQAVKYLSAFFDASQWDENLHNAQEELYSLEYAAYGSGNSVEDLISKSETLKKVFDGMATPEVLELLLCSDNGSAKNITAYQSLWDNAPVGGRTRGLAPKIEELRDLKDALAAREDANGTVDELQQTIDMLEAMFGSMVGKTGVDGLSVALEKATEHAASLENVLNSLKANSNLDNLTEADFSDLISAFPRLKKVLTDYKNGTASATRITEELQAAFDSFDATSMYDALSTAKNEISNLATAYNELGSNGEVSFSTLASLQETFGNVAGIDIYIQKIQDAKGNTREISQIFEALLYDSLTTALGSTRALADANADLITAMLKEANVANASAVAQRSIARAKKESEIASKAAKISADAEVVGLVNEAKQTGLTGSAMRNLIAQEIIFNNTGLSVAQKIKALQALGTAYGVAITGASSLNSTLNGTTLTVGQLKQQNGWSTKQALDYIQQQRSNNLTSYWNDINKLIEDSASSSFGGVDFTATGGGSGSTKADQIKSHLMR